MPNCPVMAKKIRICSVLPSLSVLACWLRTSRFRTEHAEPPSPSRHRAMKGDQRLGHIADDQLEQSLTRLGRRPTRVVAIAPRLFPPPWPLHVGPGAQHTLFI